ncbi:type II toxin-antitoxin system Phd/YefM family antitoxin [Gracilimonas mengyeensis]|uniref:Antitoxin n=1 Tax=Gracilimonas mengyeensis TaxID=1302730 RepID=A0A521EK72_9BACT|nr:type II toxin-antitoxin system Phd/YefM family antitoxin [Gracilimonas mengyeensis]SMO84318.1 prevent-host-death family protein [Gracilimonas mengyeensis]
MTTKRKKWQLQEAKNKFSEVVRKANQEGPQTVTKHGKDSVVVLSAKDYQKLERPKNSLVDFFQESLLFVIQLDVRRDKSLARDIELWVI